MTKRIIIHLLFLFSTLVSGFAQQNVISNQPRKVKNVILLIGDGMGLAQIYAGMTANKGWLHLEKCTVVGLSKTNSADRYITDSAAGATAFATGKKTNNGSVGVDSLGRPVTTVLEIAEQRGLSTGLVATTAITDATPASFIAHQPSRDLGEAIAADFLKTDIDVFIGAGLNHFKTRVDKRDLTSELKKNGYDVLYDINEVVKVNSGKLAGFVSDQRWSRGRGDQLLKSTKTAIRILEQNKKGFFLMIEGSQIDDAGHDNNSNQVIEEMLDFDNVIGEVLSFAEKNGETLVVITADHETGGYTLVDGNLQTGRVEGRFSTEGHTSVMVPVFAYGPGAETFTGIYHNTKIFDKLMKAFSFSK